MHNRYRDTAVQSQPAIAFSLSRPSDDVIPPSSNPSVIPSTAPRQSFRDAVRDSASPLEAVGATPARPVGVDRVEGTPRSSGVVSATPVRRGAMPADAAETIPGSSPLMAKRAAPGAYSGGVRSLKDVFRTPVKAKPAEQGEKTMSVYARLGWDNELDDL